MWSPTRLNQRSTAFLVYVTDLYKVSYLLTPITLTDETNLVFANKSRTGLFFQANCELHITNTWFKATKLSLNKGKKLKNFRICS